ncbi:MAG: ferrous iron transport protein A [Phycisphaerales bacterium]|nr:ferrous iron transport protein A [Phycisphaerales bacterium]
MAGQSESWCCPGGGRSLEISLSKAAAPVVCAGPAGRPAIDGPRIALAQLKPGQTARIRHADLEADDAALLRAMGLRPAAFVRMCRAGEPCIVEVYPGGVTSCACRIGLARPLADRVMCEPPVAPESSAVV